MITYATNFTVHRLTGLCRQGYVCFPSSPMSASADHDRTRTISPGLSSASVSRELFNSPAQTIKIHTYSPARWTEMAIRNKIERSRNAKLVSSSGRNQ